MMETNNDLREKFKCLSFMDDVELANFLSVAESVAKGLGLTVIEVLNYVEANLRDVWKKC